MPSTSNFIDVATIWLHAGKGGDGIISKLRTETGLDDLDLTTDDQGKERVQQEVTLAITPARLGLGADATQEQGLDFIELVDILPLVQQNLAVAVIDDGSLDDG